MNIGDIEIFFRSFINVSVVNNVCNKVIRSGNLKLNVIFNSKFLDILV